MQKIIQFRNLLPKGSVLVFSLLILSILLVTALTILSSALLDRRASLSTSTSARSFQVADSGVEEVLYQIYKGSHATLEDLGDAIVGGSAVPVRCSLSGTVPQVKFPSAGGEVTVSFYEGETTPYAGLCNGTDWRERVVKIKSEGVSGSNARAVEVAVAAAGGVKTASGLLIESDLDSSSPYCATVDYSGTGFSNPPAIIVSVADTNNNAVDGSAMDRFRVSYSNITKDDAEICGETSTPSSNLFNAKPSLYWIAIGS